MDKRIVITIQYYEDQTVVFHQRVDLSDQVVRGGYSVVFTKTITLAAAKFWDLLIMMDKIDKFKLG